LEATGAMLTSGDPSLIERLSPELSKMTGKLVQLGHEPDRAASFKLLGNSFLMFLTAGMGDLLSLAKALGIEPSETSSLFQFFNPGAAMPSRIERILAGRLREPTWELSMARKDARLMMEAAHAGGVPLAVLPAIAELMDQWIERGHGRDDWTVIATTAIER
jgi:3-hydroxyisobutyrate dehydrogenase